jgi:KRAB domain-containing zinc finger protein
MPQDCLYCDRHFSSKRSFHSHVQIDHSNTKTFYCALCKLYLKSKEEKRVHFKEQHSEKHKCILCSKAFSRNDHLRSHLQKNHLNQFFECKYFANCGKFFKSKDERKLHIFNVHESRPGLTKCIYCKKMIQHCTISRHMLFRHKLVAIKCEYVQNCPTYFHTQAERNKHYLDVHNNHGAHKPKCSICGKFLSNVRSIYNHMRLHHKIELASDIRSEVLHSKCPYCHSKVKALSQHISKFHKSIAIRCNFYKCGTYFLNEEERRQHILKVHSTTKKKKIKTNKCVYCGVFVNDYSEHVKNVHSTVAIRCKYSRCATYFHSKNDQKKHYDEKHSVTEKIERFKCSQCSYKGINTRSVQLHYQRKHGNAIFKCNVCHKKYSSMVSLNHHIKHVHKTRSQCFVCKLFVSNLKEHALSGNCAVDLKK